MTDSSYRNIKRRKTRKIYVGNVPVGGDSPITVQSMTNTPTYDIAATVKQIQSLQKVGADIVRVSCPDKDSAKALKEIIKQVEVPIISDIHFDYRLAIESAKSGAACLRINPGNIGSDERIKEVIKVAKDNNCSMRIGVNAGSLEKELLEKYGEPCPEAMVESALSHAKILEDNDFFNFKISVKASDTLMTMAAYRGLSKACDYPLHLGVTEAGGLMSGTVKSAIGIGGLLLEGIGDTLRVSLTAEVEKEVRAGFEILKALDIRHRGVKIISCPTCARKGFDVVKVVNELEKRLEHITTPISLSVLGCVVNGIGEAKETDIGFTGGGAGQGMVYIDGKATKKISNEKIVDCLVELVEQKIQEKK